LSALTSAGFDASGIKFAAANDARVDQSVLSQGDIVVSRSNTPDRVGLAGIYCGDPSPCSYPDLMMRVRLRESLHPSYCLYSLLAPAGRRYFMENARGSSGSMVKIDRKILEAFPLHLPSIAEQQAIGATLSDADGLLARLDALIAKKRDLKQAAMQQLLTGKIRLPGFSGEWRVSKLGDIARIKTGSRNNEDKLWQATTPRACDTAPSKRQRSTT
jgi:type I restriction enzyme, S subunit